MSATHCASGLSIVHKEKQKVYQISEALRWKQEQILRYFLTNSTVPKTHVFQAWANVPHDRKQRVKELLGMFSGREVRDKREKQRIALRAWKTVLKDLAKQQRFDASLKAANFGYSKRTQNLQRVVNTFLGRQGRQRVKKLAFCILRRARRESKNFLTVANSFFLRGLLSLCNSLFRNWVKYFERSKEERHRQLNRCSRVSRFEALEHFVQRLVGKERSKVLSSIFGQWHSWVSLARSFYVAHHLSDRAAIMRNQLLQKAAALLFENRKTTGLSQILAAWVALVQASRKAKESPKYMLMGNVITLVLRCFLQDWHHLVRKRQLERQQSDATRKARELCVEVAQRSLQKLAESTRDVVMANVFIAWSKPSTAFKNACFAAASLMGKQGTRQMYSVVLEWSRWASEALTNRRSSIQKAAILLESRGRMDIMRALQSWRRQAAIIARLAIAELQHAKSLKEKQENFTKVIGTILGNQDSACLSSAVFGWIHVAHEARKARGSTRKILRSMVDRQARTLTDTAFLGWAQLVSESKMLETWIQFHEVSKRKLQSAQHVMQVFTANQCEQLLASSLHGWRRNASSRREHRFRAYARERRVEMLSRSLQRFAHNVQVGQALYVWLQHSRVLRRARHTCTILTSDNRLLLRLRILLAWKQATMHDIWEEKDEEQCRMLGYAAKVTVRQAESLRRASLMLFLNSQRFDLFRILGSWQNHVGTSARQRRRGFMHRRLGRILASKALTPVTGAAFWQWKAVVQKAYRVRLVKTAETWLLMAAVFAQWKCDMAFRRAQNLTQETLAGSERREREWRLTLKRFQYRLVSTRYDDKARIRVRRCFDAWVDCRLTDRRSRRPSICKSPTKGFRHNEESWSPSPETVQSVPGAIKWARGPHMLDEIYGMRLDL